MGVAPASSRSRRAGGSDAGDLFLAVATTRLLLPCAVLLPLVILGVSAWASWRATLSEARADVSRVADAAAGYVRRVLDGHRLRADHANEVLRGLSDETILVNERELRARLAAWDRGNGDANRYTVVVFGADGTSLVSAHASPMQPASIADRPYFQALAQSPDVDLHLGEVYLGRNTGTAFFPLVRRRTETGNGRPPGAFDGLITVGVRPGPLAQRLQRLTGSPLDVLTLMRSDGAVLVRTESIPAPPPWHRPLDPDLAQALSAGVPRLLFQAVSPLDGVVRLVAYRKVEGWPAYVTAARPESIIIARWWHAVSVLLALGVPASLALAVLAWVAQRSGRQLLSGNAELERRVAWRTAELARSEQRLRLALDAARLGTWEVDLAQGRARRSERMLEILGLGPEHADAPYPGLRGHTHPADREHTQAVIRRAVAGEISDYVLQYRFRRPDDRWVWVETHGRVVARAPDGSALRIAGTIADITERREAEERRLLLARELDHRAKNALAIVQAALRLTPRTDPDRYAAAVEGRVAALARAHTMLAEGGWVGAELRALLQAELTSFLRRAHSVQDAPRAELSGPHVMLTPQAAQSLSLAFHELAMNAVKHGALSTPSGRLEVSWRIDQASTRLELRWAERGGPAPGAPPNREGFGSRLVFATVRGQLAGGLEQSWTSEGLVYDISVPLARITNHAGEERPAEAAV